MKPYYGWLVLAASAVSELLVQGATSYAAGLFVLPLQAEFHISRLAAGSSILILFLGVAVVAPFAGWVLDRQPIRRVMVAGALIFSATLALIALTTSLPVMALAVFVPGAIGFMLLGPLTTSTLASRWFWKRRGLALGLAALATSGGAFVVVPLLSQAIRLYGWRSALLMEAAVLATVIILLALLVLRDRPADMGLDTHPENSGRDTQAVAIPTVGWRNILTSHAFWVPCLVIATVSGISQVVIITLVPYGVQLGLAPTTAAWLISVFGIAAAVTKIGAGLMADRLPQRVLLIAGAASMALSLGLLYAFSSYGMLAVSAGLAGVALGFTLPTGAAMIAGAFGSASFGTAMGGVYTVLGLFAIWAVLYAGHVFDRTHDYHPAFLTFAVIAACVLLAALFFAPRQRRNA